MKKKVRKTWSPAVITHPLGKLRVRFGISRAYVAEKLQVTYPTLWRWETQTGKPHRVTGALWVKLMERLTKPKKRKVKDGTHRRKAA